jgi:hypothetical protein
VKYGVHESAPVVDSYVVYAPWPGYIPDENPYGWHYGVRYSPTEFRSAYSGWHRSFVASGRAFCGLRSHYGAVQSDLIVQSDGPRFGLRSVSPSKYSRTAGAGHYNTTLPHSPSRYPTLGSGLRFGSSRYSPSSRATGTSRYRTSFGTPTVSGGQSPTTSGELGYRHSFGSATPSTGGSKYSRSFGSPTNPSKDGFGAPTNGSRYQRGSSSSGSYGTHGGSRTQGGYGSRDRNAPRKGGR